MRVTVRLHEIFIHPICVCSYLEMVYARNLAKFRAEIAQEPPPPMASRKDDTLFKVSEWSTAPPASSHPPLPLTPDALTH